MAKQTGESATHGTAPTTRRPRVRWLILAAAVTGCLLFLLWWFDPGTTGISTCGLYIMTGLYCPGCGATRATHELLRGHLLAALQYNGLWVLTLPLVLYAVASEVRRYVYDRPLPGNPAEKMRWWIALAVLCVVFFVLRNIPGYPLSLLAPPG